MTTLFLLLSLFFQAASPAPRGNAENGKVLFAKIGCYQCHGREGQGATATGPRLNQNPITYARFVSYIRKPSGEMPPYTAKVVTDQQMADIYAFLQSLSKPSTVESIPLLKQ
jgi:ubiquinol-cytochrome c reductase cytochrome c subunit